MTMVSIVIPIYNCEKYLEQCIKSALRQTLKELELICVDDGSTDNSAQIIKSFQEEDARILLFQQKNQGAGAARNLGIQKAQGKYIAFLDADDFYLDADALEKMVLACEKNHLGACAGFRKVYQNDLLKDFYLYRDCFENGKNKDGVLFRYQDYQNEYHYQNYIFSLEILRKNGIVFPLYRRYQDAPFFLNAMVAIKEYMVLPVEFYAYRFPEEALTRKETHIEDTLKGIRDNIQTAQKNQLYELEKILVGRVGLEYAKGIIKGANGDVLGLLHEIRVLVFGKDKKRTFAELQAKSFDNVHMLVEMNVKGIKLGDYFEKKGIKDIAIYGLGNYGSIVIEELKKSEKITLYGVDRQAKTFPGVETGSLEEVNRKCTDIVVTPAEDNDGIVDMIKKVWNGKVWGLNELLRQAFGIINIMERS